MRTHTHCTSLETRNLGCFSSQMKMHSGLTCKARTSQAMCFSFSWWSQPKHPYKQVQAIFFWRRGGAVCGNLCILVGRALKRLMIRLMICVPPGSVTAPPCTVGQSGFGLVNNLGFQFAFHHKPEIKGLKWTAQETTAWTGCVWWSVEAVLHHKHDIRLKTNGIGLNLNYNVMCVLTLNRLHIV